ncbi:MAG: hypothetical protein K2P81_12865 [Bacteriovoracaceae bacterium]|nr:hypothetical protein [Bacteriovoracaceae bacterium]
MESPSYSQSVSWSEIAKNLDFSIRSRKASSLLVVSEFSGEGKTSFIENTMPLMKEIYGRRILCVDFSKQAVSDASSKGVDYLQRAPITDFQNLSENEKISMINKVVQEAKADYDLVIVEAHSNKNLSNYSAFDGCVLVRSNKSITNNSDSKILEKLKEAECPVIGLVYNGALS